MGLTNLVGVSILAETTLNLNGVVYSTTTPWSDGSPGRIMLAQAVAIGLVNVPPMCTLLISPDGQRYVPIESRRFGAGSYVLEFGLDQYLAAVVQTRVYHATFNGGVTWTPNDPRNIYSERTFKGPWISLACLFSGLDGTSGATCAVAAVAN
jgi:hypothetical protein